jgi:hypothetical protein
MTPTQFAILLIRIFGVFASILAAAALTEIAYGIFSVIYSSSAQSEPLRAFLLAMYVVRFLIYFCTAIIFLVFTKPLAKLFTKGLD